MNTMSSRPYTDFRNKLLGKRVDYDNFAGYQCVDLIKVYLDSCLGMGTIGRIGNASDIRENRYSYFNNTWEKIPGTNNLMQWDIIISTKGKYGHIAIVDHVADGKVRVLEQNGAGQDSGSGLWANAVRVKDYDPSFWAGVRRCKKIFDHLQLERTSIEQKVQKLSREIFELQQQMHNTTVYREGIRFKK